jgi:hypothetical protein
MLKVIRRFVNGAMDYRLFMTVLLVKSSKCLLISGVKNQIFSRVYSVLCFLYIGGSYNLIYRMKILYPSSSDELEYKSKLSMR